MVDAILKEREKTHGDFTLQANLSQILKNTCRNSPNYLKLSQVQREGLEMVLHKISRILCGDYNHKDSYIDICGYTELIIRSLDENKKP